MTLSALINTHVLGDSFCTCIIAVMMIKPLSAIKEF